MKNDLDRLETIPMLPSLNIERTVTFFANLGFTHELAGPNYVLLRRKHIELHYWLYEDKAICESSSCYIRGGGIDELHEEFSENGVTKVSALKLRPWNMYELHIMDPDGVLLKFGRVP